jgi:hypothetical protein
MRYLLFSLLIFFFIFFLPRIHAEEVGFMIYCYEKENSLKLIEIIKRKSLTYKELIKNVWIHQDCGALGGEVTILEEISTIPVMVTVKGGRIVPVMIRHVYIKYGDFLQYGLIIGR